MQSKATYTFYSELNDFLHKKKRNKTIEHFFKNSPTVKDSFEALGIPHREVALILSNKQAITFDYRVNNNDNIHVYPYFNDLQQPDLIPIKPEGCPKFILDVHLGVLAKYLRMAGFDVLYNNDDWGDKYIADTGGEENRIVLSRDIGLLKRSSVIYGYYLRNKDSYKQFQEVSLRYGLSKYFAPFTRCIKCNGSIYPVTKKEVEEDLEKGTKGDYDEFWQCIECKQIYWHGSHYKRMISVIEEIKRAI